MTKLILVDLVEDEDVEEIRPRTDPPNVWQCAILDRSETGWNSASEHDSGDREAVPDQGGSVIPDDETAHKEIRPKTQLLS